jgi:hypothetical protein
MCEDGGERHWVCGRSWGWEGKCLKGSPVRK